MKESAKFHALAFLALLLGPVEARGAGDYSPVGELATTFHTGGSAKSMTGAFGLSLVLRVEGRRGYFRSTTAAELQTVTGKVSLGGAEINGSVWGFGFQPGFHFFPVAAATIMPFVGGSGILGWNYMKLVPPPTGVDPQTQGLSFGYEVAAGVDIRMGRADGNALRIRSSYLKVSSSLGGQSGFVLDGFRLSIGTVW